MTAFGDLYDLGTEVLDFVVTLLTPAVIGYGAEVPANRFVANGAVAYDFCDLLAVELLPARVGPPGPPLFRIIDATSTLNVDMAVHLIRCAPALNDEGDAPTATAIEANARIVLADAWTLLHGVLAGVQDHSLLPACAQVVITSLESYGPEGGAAGSVLRLNVGL